MPHNVASEQPTLFANHQKNLDLTCHMDLGFLSFFFFFLIILEWKTSLSQPKQYSNGIIK